MSRNPDMTQAALRQHVDVFVNNFFLYGARNHIRKTTRNAPWLNLGIMERMNAEGFYEGKLFSGMNIVGGNAYSFGNGYIHGYLERDYQAQIKRAADNLNALGACEIIFYHDESVRGLEVAEELGIALRFTPVSLLEWLVRELAGRKDQVRPLDASVAVQLPCSWKPGDGKNELLEELFNLIGIHRVERRYDYNGRMCCGIRGYFGLATGDTARDANKAEAAVLRNVEDAKAAGADYLLTTCPFCYAALATTAGQHDVPPVQVESLVNLALHGEALPGGLCFL